MVTVHQFWGACAGQDNPPLSTILGVSSLNAFLVVFAIRTELSVGRCLQSWSWGRVQCAPAGASCLGRGDKCQLAFMFLQDFLQLRVI